MSKKSLDDVLELMNLVSEQFGGFRIDLANGDSMKIADVLRQVGELLDEYDLDLDHFRRRAENAELANAHAIARHAEGMADVLAIVRDVVTGKTPGKAPGLDIIEVVRCKDCKHRGNFDVCPMAHISLGDPPYDENDDFTEDDGFCHKGEREEEHE